MGVKEAPAAIPPSHTFRRPPPFSSNSKLNTPHLAFPIIAVVYREISRNDGFFITAYFTSRIAKSSIRWRKA